MGRQTPRTDCAARRVQKHPAFSALFSEFAVSAHRTDVSVVGKLPVVEQGCFFCALFSEHTLIFQGKRGANYERRNGKIRFFYR